MIESRRMPENFYLISCDWGTSNFRLRLLTGRDSPKILADRTSAQPMPATVLATPTINRASSALPAALDCAGILDELDELEDVADFDETFDEILSRANGTPRHADRLRSHLN